MNQIQKYGIIGSFKLLFSYLYTKIVFRHARLIRLPVDIRNRKLIKVGRNFTTGKYCRLEAHPFQNQDASIHIGDNVQINDAVHIVGSIGVVIGNNVLIASKVYISDISHGNYKGVSQDSPIVSPDLRRLSHSKVHIEDDVWIGEFVSVLPGITIGKGSIIGTMSVVTKSIPPYCIAVGCPARVIKAFDFDSKSWVRV